MTNNRIGPTRNPVAADAGDARTATPTPAGAQEHLAPPPGFPARRPRSPGDDDNSRNVRRWQAQPQISELPALPFGLFSSPGSPGFPDIAPQLLERQPSPGLLAESPTGRGSPDGGWFTAALKSYGAALGQQAAAHSEAGTSVSQSTLHQQVVQGANLTHIDRSFSSRELRIGVPRSPQSPGLPEVWQHWARSGESSPAGLAELPLAESPKGNWLSSALQDIEAALRERGAAHPGAGPSAPQATMQQIYTQQHQLSMNLPVTAGMPSLSLRLEKTTSYQLTIEPSGFPPGGGNPVRQVPPGQPPQLLAAVSELPIPAGDDALIGKLTDAQPPDSQVRVKQVVLHRLANWLHESGREGLEKLLAKSPEARQKIVNDFLTDLARRHFDSASVVPPAPPHIVNILHDSLQALEGVQEASASTAIARSSQQPFNAADIDQLIRRYFQ